MMDNLTLDKVKKAVELGAKGFIVKPYTRAKVRDIIKLTDWL